MNELISISEFKTNKLAEEKLTLIRNNFEEKIYYTTMCPECNCSIDIFSSLNTIKTTNCESCGTEFDLK